MQFQISSRKENRQSDIPVIKIRVIRKVFTEQFCFIRWRRQHLHANRGGTADLILLITLLTSCQKSQEPSFWEVMDSFVLVAYASLAASRTLLERLLACLNFTLDSEDLLSSYKQKK